MGRKYLENIIIKMDSQPERLLGGECGVSGLHSVQEPYPGLGWGFPSSTQHRLGLPFLRPIFPPFLPSFPPILSPSLRSFLPPFLPSFLLLFFNLFFY